MQPKTWQYTYCDFTLQKINKNQIIFLLSNYRNPILRKCEDETHTPEMRTWESSGTLKILEFDCTVKKFRIWAFYNESYRSVDVKNGLAWGIWTYVAQVIAKRKVRSKTVNLTLDH
jgi:hypothetical protein